MQVSAGILSWACWRTLLSHSSGDGPYLHGVSLGREVGNPMSKNSKLMDVSWLDHSTGTAQLTALLSFFIARRLKLPKRRWNEWEARMRFAPVMQ